LRILVTGHAGFIGFHLAAALLGEGHAVHGLDCVNDYYDVNLKHRRLALLKDRPGFSETRASLEDHAGLLALFERFRPEVVVHLAAQAGVRYSVENPRAYLGANMVGSFNLLEACRAFPVQHLLLASTSSAYGANEKFPFEETDRAVHPMTLYAASKGAMELMAHAYAHLFGTPTTAFRFFTVYGPWGRPDMAYFLFTRAILEGKPISLFNHGESWRDFTFIDDLVASIRRLIDCVPPGVEARAGPAPIPVAPYRLVNIGAGRPEKVTSLVDALEQALGVPAQRELKPRPPGDVVKTFANADLLFALTGQRPATPLGEGIARFVEWYRSHYN
jgi:UDP-glucuronate 4-epimerase